MPALSQAFSTSGQNQDHLTERAVVRPVEPAHRRAAVARRTWARQRVALSTSLPIVPVAGRGTVPLNTPIRSRNHPAGRHAGTSSRLLPALWDIEPARSDDPDAPVPPSANPGERDRTGP